MSLLKQKLINLADDYDEKGFGRVNDLSVEEHADFEALINEAINADLPEEELNNLLKIRFMLRILLKYGQDIDKGLNILSNVYLEMERL